MACEILVSYGAVLTVWGEPRERDMERVLAEVARAAQNQGRPIVYVARVPRNAPPPDAKARHAIDAQLPTLMKSCSSYHLILEGSGLLTAMKRGVLRPMLQPIWQRRVFFAHASIPDMLHRISSEDRVNVGRLLELAAGRGLLQCPPLESVPPPPPP